MQATASLTVACALAMMPWTGVGHASDHDLGTVVVFGSAIEETLPVDLQRYGNRLEVLSGESLRRGYVDLSHALQMLVPGLYLTPKNGPFDYVEASLQGSRGSDLLYLVDGVRISNRLYNTTSPLDTIPVQAIERVEVLKGGQGIFFGTQALAGVVNIVTRSFSEKPEFTAEATVGSAASRGFGTSWRGSFGGTRLVAFASKNEADGTQAFRARDYQPSGTDRERGYDVGNVGLKVARTFADRYNLEVNYRHTDATLDFAQPYRVARAFNERDEDSLSVKFEANLSDAVGFYVKAYHHRWKSHYSEIDNDLPISGTTTTISDREYWGFKDQGLNLMSRLRVLPAAELLVGADLQRYDGSDDVLLIAPRTEQVKAGFLQLRSTAESLPDTQLAAGLRYNDAGRGRTSTVWSLNGRHTFENGAYLRATGASSFRLPDAYELYAIDPFDVNGNPELKPERGVGGDVGIGAAWRGGVSSFSVEAMYFSRRVKELIDFVDDGSENGTWGNTHGEIRMSGIEVTGKYSVADWTLSVDHTAAQARAADDGTQLHRQPRHQTKASLVWRNEALGLGASLDATRVGTMTQQISGVGVQRYGDYFIADLSAQWRFGTDRHHSLGLRVANLFDQEYASRLGRASRDDTGRSYAAWHLGSPRNVLLQYSFNSRAPD